MSKRLLVGGKIGCKDKKISRDIFGFPDCNSIGSTVYYREETYRCTGHLH